MSICLLRSKEVGVLGSYSSAPPSPPAFSSPTRAQTGRPFGREQSFHPLHQLVHLFIPFTWPLVNQRGGVFHSGSDLDLAEMIRSRLLAAPAVPEGGFERTGVGD